MTNTATEHSHWHSEFSHEKWWFPMVMLVYQRVFAKKKSTWGLKSPQRTWSRFFQILSFLKVYVYVRRDTMRHLINTQRCFQSYACHHKGGILHNMLRPTKTDVGCQWSCVCLRRHKYYLVGGMSYPSEKYESQLGWWHSQCNIWKN